MALSAPFLRHMKGSTADGLSAIRRYVRVWWEAEWPLLGGKWR